MSDDDFMQESDGEQYEFEYEDDEDDESAANVGIENKYYNAKQLKLADPEDALVEFLSIPTMEQDKGDWGFKGLKQAIKLEYKLGKFSKATEHFAEVLTYVKSAVMRNYAEKSINNMLDYIEKGSEGQDGAVRCLEDFYALTLQTFQSTQNERLWLKTNIKLVRLLLDRHEYGTVTRKLREMYKACVRADGSDDPGKGTYLLEMYALEIQMHAETKNNKQLKRLYERALQIRSAVPHPKIMGIIRECGGKMHMSEENWTEAQSDFFESFRNFDEAGSLQRIQVLKYLILATMLMKSNINPFDSQEIKPYKSDGRVSAMTELVDAYQRDDVHAYERALQNNRAILTDPFIAENIDQVTRDMRIKGVLKMVAPYSRMRISSVAEQLQISDAEVEDIVGYLISDGRIKGSINQKTGTLEMVTDPDAGRAAGMQQLSRAARQLYEAVLRDGVGFTDSTASQEQTFDGSGLGTASSGREHRVHLLRTKRGNGTISNWL